MAYRVGLSRDSKTPSWSLILLPDSDVVHRAKGFRMLLAQGPLPCFYHSLRQLQRFLSSTRLAVPDSESVRRGERVSAPGQSNTY